jgi:ribosomal protein S18 acetylase RimI-like enzyme
MLVARQGEEIVGTMRLIEANQGLFGFRHFTPANVAVYLIGLAVSPQSRGRGVGRQLVDFATQAARDWPADALWLDTYDHAAGAGGFYEKCGFRRVGESFNQAALRYYEWRVGDE